MVNDLAIADFRKAREQYLARRFASAREIIQRYRSSIDYAQFKQSDCRGVTEPEISVVIVSYSTQAASLECISSVFVQSGPRFEVILVDNGGNESIHAELAAMPGLLWIRPPINLLPSEGRNIGAHFAKGPLLAFLDDDAVMAPGYLEHASRALEDKCIVALRGRAMAKNPLAHVRSPKQYDLGEAARPAELNLEGNCVIRRDAYAALQGFDPLMFGHEGRELTRRCKARYPDRQILYWPSLVIRHDYAEGESLAAKRHRQAVAIDYLKYLEDPSLNEGVSIFIRAGDNLAAAEQFLASFVKHNTYKPVEVLLSTTDMRRGLDLVKNYLGRIWIRQLASKSIDIHQQAKKFRFDHVLIVKMPFLVESDVIRGLISRSVRLDGFTYMNRQAALGQHDRSLHMAADSSDGKADVVDTTGQTDTAGTVLEKSNSLEGLRSKYGLVRPSVSASTEICQVVSGKHQIGARTLGGMATIPQRQSTLPEVLSRLAPQFDELHVYLNGYERKPLIGDLPNVVLHLSDDYGDLGAKGKFYGLNFAGVDDYYFALDDDFLYPDDYVTTLKTAMSRYKDTVAVCVHGSIFGDPLDWYFERVSTFSSRQGLDRDRFVNLAGTGTFACKLSSFPIRLLDVMPRTMCDLQISIKARKLHVPLVSIKRRKNWLRSIAVDNVSANGADYWSKMLIDDEGRTDVAKKIAWDFVSCKGYILDVLRKANIPLEQHDSLLSGGFDVEFLDAANNGDIPKTWNSRESKFYFLRKYQYYASLLEGEASTIKRGKNLPAPHSIDLEQIKMLAYACKDRWESLKHD